MRVPVFRDTLRDLNRMRQIASVVGRHGFGEFLDRARLWDLLGSREATEVDPNLARQGTAARFRDLLAELGPSFVKLGQVLSSRSDLLPAEWIDELRTLQDRVSPVPLSTLLETLETSLGQEPTTLFASIDEAPLASASIAQVHRARTRNGEEVVVKIQRPGIEETIRADLAILETAAQLLEAVVEETGIYGPVALVEEFRRSLMEELDFLNEARNVATFRLATSSMQGLYVPKVYESLSGKQVLTLEYLAGPKITEAPKAEDHGELARKLLEGGFHLLFDQGIFHGDPHPGNLLALEDGRIGLIDFGLVGRVTPQMQETLVLLVLAVSVRDADSVARLICRVGIPDGRTNLSAFRQDIDAILRNYLGRSLKEISSRELLRELLDLAVHYRIKIPKEYALLSKALMTTEGIVRDLDPELDLLAFGMPYAKQLLSGRFDPASMLGVDLGMKSLLRLTTLFQEVPTQLSQILLDLEGGKLAITSRSPEVSSLERTVRGLGVTLFLGMLASASLLGGWVALARLDGVVWGWLPLPALVAFAATATAGFFFWAAISWSAMRGRVRKIRLSRWLARLAGPKR